MHRSRSLVAVVACVAIVTASCAASGSDASGGLPERPTSEQEAAAPSVDGSAPSEPDAVAPPPAQPAPDPQPGPEPEPEPEPEPQPTTHAPAPEPADPFELSPAETLPGAKRVASDVVQTLLTYDPEDEVSRVVVRADPTNRDPDLLRMAEPVLHDDAWSRGEIVYPQLGGFTATSASVMVVARQTVGVGDGEVFEQTRTFDVRLVQDQGSWVFDHLASAGGEVAERPDGLSEAAVAVLDDDRIELPDSARWDIHRGMVEPTLLELMSLMADRTEYGVVVLDTGHPWEVFGTDRQSRHSMGRAVDIYRLRDVAVIDDRAPDSKLHEFVRWLYEQPGMNNMGSPWALDGYGGRSFTDELHQDHLHVEAAAPESP